MTSKIRSKVVGDEGFRKDENFVTPRSQQTWQRTKKEVMEDMPGNVFLTFKMNESSVS